MGPFVAPSKLFGFGSRSTLIQLATRRAVLTRPVVFELPWEPRFPSEPGLQKAAQS